MTKDRPDDPNRGEDPRSAIAGALKNHGNRPLGVAVSGGSDSMALMLLLADWAQGRIPLHIVTVDHNLRPEAAEEADFVAKTAARLNLPHDTLRWDGPDATGNLSDQARRARYALMARWAQGRGIGHIALGHTADDQAETLMMRLARGAGVDGLAQMSARRDMHGVTFLRPMLSLRRAALRRYLDAHGQAWIDDPTNDDASYDRVRIRQALPDLAPLGLTVEALTQVAQNLADARDTLDHYAAAEAARLITQDAGGDLLIPLADWTDLPHDMQRRLMQAALAHVAGPGYPPRRRALTQVLTAVAEGTGQPLMGCLIRVEERGKARTIRITREPAALTDLSTVPGDTWDARWHLTGPFDPGDRIAMTGAEGLRTCPNWRDTGLPRATLIAAPAVWRGTTLIAAPLAGLANGFAAELIRNAKDLTASLRTH